MDMPKDTDKVLKKIKMYVKIKLAYNNKESF